MGSAAREVQQYVYRSVVRELAPGRFARTEWVREPWFDRNRDLAPRRATEGQLKPKVSQPKKKGTPGPKPKLNPEDCPPFKQSFRFIETIPNKVGQGFTVRARCSGIFCNGKSERVFSMYFWCDPERRANACHRCVCAQRRIERKAKRDALREAGQPIYVTPANQERRLPT